MTNFSHLKELEVKDKTADYTIYQIIGEPTLIVKPATEANKAYFNSVLRQSRRNISALKGQINAKTIKRNRDEDKKLYPKSIITGWKDVRDNEGKSVKFSIENAGDFIEALPDWVFDDLRGFCGDPSNFFGEQIDVEEKLGN